MDYRTGRLFLPASRIFAAGFTHAAVRDDNARVGDRDLQGSPVQLVHRILNEPFLRAAYVLYIVCISNWKWRRFGWVIYEHSTRSGPTNAPCYDFTAGGTPYRRQLAFSFLLYTIAARSQARSTKFTLNLRFSPRRDESNRILLSQTATESWKVDDQETTNFVSCFEKYHFSLASGQTHD